MNIEEGKRIYTIRDLLALDEWQYFQADKLGNNLFITDPDRAQRIHDAAEDGCDGSTHYEVIEDWREFAELLRRELLHQASSEGDEESEAEIESNFDLLTAEIDACESFHRRQKTLHEQIG